MTVTGDPEKPAKPTSRYTRRHWALLGRRPVLRWLVLLVIVVGALSWLALFYSGWSLDSIVDTARGWDGILRVPSIWDEYPPPAMLEPQPPKPVFHSDPESQERWNSRKEDVKQSFLHAWKGYMKYAYPHDELEPLSGNYTNNLNGWSLTLVDSLSTMWIMGLKTEFRDAVQAIKHQKFTKSSKKYIPFFETVIRYLGGYLSAYSLSGEPALLALADDLGKTLLTAFDTSTGLPAGGVQPLPHGRNLMYGDGLLAEMASCQLEFTYLAKLTGHADYYTKPHYVNQYLASAEPRDGLFAERWSIQNGGPTGGITTVAANTDSAYEYFLKQYLMFGDGEALKMYLKAVEGMLKHLIYITPRRGLVYVTDLTLQGFSVDQRPNHISQHLGCFLGGLIALGANLVTPERLRRDFPRMTSRQIERLYPSATRQRHKWVAEALTYTCYVLYADQPSGLSSDAVRFDITFEDPTEVPQHDQSRSWFSSWASLSGTAKRQNRKWTEVVDEWERRGGPGPGWFGVGAEEKPPGLGSPPAESNRLKRDYTNLWPEKWLMRPETVESIYIMWKVTGDPVWRERGYEIYRAIEKNTRTQYGYSSVFKVSASVVVGLEEMPSYFLAETLKYLYLLFEDEDPVDLEKWVFNTEAHPLPVVQWTEEERRKFKMD